MLEEGLGDQLDAVVRTILFLGDGERVQTSEFGNIDASCKARHTALLRQTLFFSATWCEGKASSLK